MGKFVLSIHANERFQQRGFKNDLYDFICLFGSYARSYDDSFILSISRNELLNLLENDVVDEVTKDFIKKNFDKIIKKKIVVREDAVITLYNAA